MNGIELSPRALELLQEITPTGGATAEAEDPPEVSFCPNAGPVAVVLDDVEAGLKNMIRGVFGELTEKLRHAESRIAQMETELAARASIEQTIEAQSSEAKLTVDEVIRLRDSFK